MRPLNAGVIGLGVGERHAAGYRQIPGVTLRAICDLDPDRLAAVGDRLGVGERHGDYRRITEHPEIDLVSICSHDDAHVEQAVSAFRHGKHVMIEKPVALTRPDAERLLRAWADSARQISSNLILRRVPRFRELRAAIAGGEFGEIVAIEGDYVHRILHKLTQGWRGRMDFYCVTYGGGIHLIDLMRWLIGQEVVEICGMGNKMLTRGSAYRFDDTIVNLLRFDGGTLGKTLSILGPQRRQLHALTVYGTRRTFVNDIPHGKLFTGDRPEDERAVTTPYPGIGKDDLLPGFVAAIRAGTEPEVGARDIFRVMDVCFAAWESARTGRMVKPDYLL